MLKEQEKITDDIINNLMSWRHSDFIVHNGVRAATDDDKGRENIIKSVRLLLIFL